MMQLSDDTKAVLLLCGYFGRRDTMQRLTLAEYVRLALWLREVGMRPSSLLDPDNAERAIAESGFGPDRLRGLLSRGVLLGFMVESWQQKGVWVLSRSDEAYPARFRTHLGMEHSPALLFGVGDVSLLGRGGLGITGVRNADETGLAMARETGALCAASRATVISGYSKGTEQAAMEGALLTGGTAVGIVADSLLKYSVGKVQRKALADKALVLVSAAHPESQYTVTNAMERNRLVYSLADQTLVVSAQAKKGITWAGAEEELSRSKPRPVFVRAHGDIPRANERIMSELGAHPWPVGITVDSFAQTLKEAVSSFATNAAQDENPLLAFTSNDSSPAKEALSAPAQAAPPAEAASVKSVPELADSIYEAVLPVLVDALASPADVAELAKTAGVDVVLMTKWLKRAQADGKVKEVEKPGLFVRV